MSGKKRELILNKNKKADAAGELSNVFNAIKDEQVKSGNILGGVSVNIVEFAGKTLRINKSVLLNNKQYRVEKGKKWEEIDMFFKKNIAFSTTDFEK